MRVRLIVAVGLIAATVRCGPAAEKCGEAICTKEQRCTASKTCVTDNPPTLKVDAPLEGAMVSTTSVEVTGTASDDEPGVAVELSTNKTTWIPTKLAADGSFTVQLPLPTLDFSAGSVSVRARDSKGRLVTVSRQLLVDNAPPACAIAMPGEGVFLTTTGAVMVSMHASDGSQVLNNPRVSTDGAATFTPLTATAGDFTYSWALSTENGVAHDVIFRVEDASAHPCEAKVSVTVDNVKPTIAFSTPLSSALLGVPFFTSGGLVGGTAADGMRPLKSVTLDFADGAGPKMATLSTTGNKAWSVNVPKPLADDYKVHNATAVVTDLAGNTATATLTVTVDVKAPALTITSPTMGGKLNISNFPASNNAPMTWVLSDADPQLTIGVLLPDGGFITPPVVPTSPTDNPKAYNVTLRANDRAGNSTTATVAFTVDRVAPSVVTTTPTNGSRMFVGPTSVDFSEPMMGGDGLNMNPFAQGNWTTPSHFEVPNLLKDKVYVAATGAATDLHGNPLVASSYKFHTETWKPTSGSSLIGGYAKVYDAATDSEGVINLVAEKSLGGAVEWIQFDSSTGYANIIDSEPALSFAGRLVAARAVQPDLTSRRLAGLMTNSGSGDTVRYNINGGAQVAVVGSAQAFIPTPPFAGEGGVVAEFGVIAGGFYKRTGRANVAISLASISAISVSDTHWQIMTGNAGGTESQDFGCSPTCTLSGVKTLGGGSIGYPNAAISNNCAVHGYQSAGFEKTTMFRYQPGCGPTPNPNPCAPDLTEDNNFDEVVADAAQDGTFYGYATVSAGTFQLKKRTLTATTCSGGVVDVGAPITIGTIQGLPRLIVVRGVPGLLFPAVNGNITYVTP